MSRLIVLAAAVALLFVSAVWSEDPVDRPSALTAAVVVEAHDLNMQLAQDCLTNIRESTSNDGDTVLVKLLEATGFRLTKVLAKEYKEDPERIRFGFEFGNLDDVKSVYWESDCPSAGSAGRIAAR